MPQIKPRRHEVVWLANGLRVTVRQSSSRKHTLHSVLKSGHLLQRWSHSVSLLTASVDPKVWPSAKMENCDVQGWLTGCLSAFSYRTECATGSRETALSSTIKVLLMLVNHVGKWFSCSAQLNVLFNTVWLQRDLFQWVILILPGNFNTFPQPISCWFYISFNWK